MLHGKKKSNWIIDEWIDEWWMDRYRTRWMKRHKQCLLLVLSEVTST